MLVTAGATAAIGGPVRKWLTGRGKLDVPNHRSSHKTPVPRGGGIAALLGATTAALVTHARPRAGTALSIAGLSTLGWLDDASGHVPPQARLVGQISTGAFGLSRNFADAPMAAITTAGVVNVFNFMDGINGISGLTAIVWGINAILLEDESGGQLSTLGALTAGSGLGFLPHNLPTARLFLGDVGSYAFGTAIAAGILSQHSLYSRFRVGAPLILYGADGTQAILRRIIKGERLTAAHRGHVYQLLVDSGRSHLFASICHATGAVCLTLIWRLSIKHRMTASVLVVACYMISPIVAQSVQRPVRINQAP